MTKDEALRMARDALRLIGDVYVDKDDETGECASCHERSYKPHAPDCKKQLALAAIDAALAEPQVAPVIKRATKRKTDLEFIRAALDQWDAFIDGRGSVNDCIEAFENLRTRLGESHE